MTLKSLTLWVILFLQLYYYSFLQIKNILDFIQSIIKNKSHICPISNWISMKENIHNLKDAKFETSSFGS